MAGADASALDGSGYVVARAGRSDRLRREAAPVFARTWFAGTGPHALPRASGHGRADRVTPILEAVNGLHSDPVRSVWVEFPDTNEGKALSPLARALEARIAGTLVERGWIAPLASKRLHVFLVDGATAHIGTSDVETGSRWPMGIPRLAM